MFQNYKEMEKTLNDISQVINRMGVSSWFVDGDEIGFVGTTSVSMLIISPLDPMLRDEVKELLKNYGEPSPRPSFDRVKMYYIDLKARGHVNFSTLRKVLKWAQKYTPRIDLYTDNGSVYVYAEEDNDVINNVRGRLGDSKNGVQVRQRYGVDHLWMVRRLMDGSAELHFNEGYPLIMRWQHPSEEFNMEFWVAPIVGEE